MPRLLLLPLTLLLLCAVTVTPSHSKERFAWSDIDGLQEPLRSAVALAARRLDMHFNNDIFAAFRTADRNRDWTLGVDEVVAQLRAAGVPDAEQWARKAVAWADSSGNGGVELEEVSAVLDFHLTFSTTARIDEL